MLYDDVSVPVSMCPTVRLASSLLLKRGEEQDEKFTAHGEDSNDVLRNNFHTLSMD